MPAPDKPQLDPASTAIALAAPAVLFGFWLIPALALQVLEVPGGIPAELTDRFEQSDAAREVFTRDLRQMSAVFGVALLAAAGAVFAGLKARIHERHAIWLLTAAAVLVRAAALGREIIGDEGRTWTAFVQPGPLAALTFYPAPNNHVLFSAVSAAALRVTDWMTGIHLGWMIVSSLGVWGMWRLLRTLERPPVERVLGALLMASWPLVVLYGVQLRGYGPMVALVPFVLDTWFRLRREQRLVDWLLFAALGAAACSLHLFAGFLIAALALHAWILPPRDCAADFRLGSLFGMGALAVFVLALHALVLPQMWAYVQSSSGAEHFAGLQPMQLFDYFMGTGLLRFTLVSAVALGTLGFALQRRVDILFVTIVPLVLGVTAVGISGVFVFDRFFIYAAPGLVVLAVAGIWLPVDLVRNMRARSMKHIVPSALIAAGFGVALFTAAWRNLPPIYVSSGVADQLTARIGTMRPSEILVCGRFHPLVRFYFPQAERARTIERLDDAPTGHVVILSQNDEKWANAFPDVIAHLDQEYDVVWTPTPRKNSQPTDLRRAAILVRKAQPPEASGSELR